MKTVKLKNGSEEVDTLVAATRMTLSELAKTMPGWLQLYDLTMLCRDHNYSEISKTNRDALAALSLIQGGHVHDSIRNIVLSSVEGEGSGMTLVNPIEVEAAP